MAVKQSYEEAGKNSTVMQGFMRDQSDNRFTYDFVEILIKDSNIIDMDIHHTSSKKKDQGDKFKFDIESLKKDLQEYDSFKDDYMELIDNIEKEIFEK